LSPELAYAFQYEHPKLFERKMISGRLKSLQEMKKLPPELVGDLDLDIESMSDKDLHDKEWQED
jgi:hypothetical protein